MVDVHHHKPLHRNTADLRSRNQRPLLLCIEDNEDSRTMYAAFLTRAGFRVAEASDGQEGLERTLELMPDLIVLDITLPVVNGKEVLERLRANEETRLIPVIVVTGQTFPGHWRDAIDTGVEAYLKKPCPLGDLLAAVLKVISMRRAAMR
ncbi:MAG: response regulator [Polyangiaceae bacterium]